MQPQAQSEYCELFRPTPEGILVMRVWAEAEGGRFRCPCCHHLTLVERGGNQICQVCFWEDDGQDDPDADEVWGGPNRELSLTAARQNYLAFGACAEEYIRKVRPPLPSEL